MQMFTWNCGDRACRFVSSSSIRISSADTFANSNVIFVLSVGFLRMAFATWYMGVTPVPPANMPVAAKHILSVLRWTCSWHDTI